MSSQRYVLMTRPLEDSAALADALQARGFAPLIAPMLEIQALADAQWPDAAALASYKGLVFTSANAVRLATNDFWSGVPENMPVYALAPKTASLLEGRGLNIRSVPGDSKALERFIANEYKAAPSSGMARKLLHIGGADMARTLSPVGIIVDQLPVYKAEYTARFPDEVKRLMAKERIDAILFFSPRTAENFVRLIREEGLETKLSAINALCISQNVVQSVRTLDWRDVRCADSPDQDHILALLDQ